MVLTKMEPLHKEKKEWKSGELVMKIAKEMGCPVIHKNLNNGVDYEHVWNVKEKAKIDVHSTLHEGLNDHTFTLNPVTSLEKTFVILSELKRMLIGK